MQLIRCFLLLFLTGYAFIVSGRQLNLPVPGITVIDNGLSAHQYEFSALAKWKDKILLVPQNRRHVIDSVFMIDSTAIEAFLQNKMTTPYTAYSLNNIQHAGNNKNSLYINTMLLAQYDGIEADVVKGNTIFFSLET